MYDIDFALLEPSRATEVTLKIPDLSMGGPQSALIIIFAIIAILMAALFVVVAIKATTDVPYENVTKVGYFLRRYWLILLVSLAVIQVSVAAAFMPYSKDANPDVVVKVDGYQFNWAIDKPRVPAGSLVQFDVSTADVNHGVGIYDPDGELLSSVQAMPGYTNKFQLQLDKPGKYLIACLEYCGLGHHEMLKNFEVYREN